MKLGEIYFWETDKAQGFESRKKYQVFIYPSDWRADNTFLFISKANYGGDYAIYNNIYKFLPLTISYISCGSIVCYDDDEIKAAKPVLKGQLSIQDMKGLYNAVLNNEIMERQNISRVCNALKVIL
jgi:hypothetical protein